ncbi:MAG: YerC/YecD family TrpR-related protein [Patescibacteria group bacterium]
MNDFKFDKRSDELFKAVLSLKNIADCEAFFRDLCTIQELKDMRDRWRIVTYLQKGLSYRDIAKRMKTSTTTVARVAFWLKNGRGGYNSVWQELNSHHRNPSPGKGLL